MPAHVLPSTTFHEPNRPTVLSLLLPLLLGILLVGLVCGRRVLAGSTMIAPWWWMVLVVVAIASTEMLAGTEGLANQPAWLDPLRYAAAALTFCPAMAVLGAKRPQDRGWQWVVVTLWLVLILPAAQTVVYGAESRVVVPTAWQLLLAALVVLELINYLFSRHRWAALLFVAAQAVLLARHIPWPTESPYPVAVIALGLMLIAILLVAVREGATGRRDRYEQVWTRMADWYGAFWTFRAMSLLNQSAAAARWPVRLMPFGFVNDAHPPRLVSVAALAPDRQREIGTALRNTLRRFLSEQMLDRLNDEPDRGHLGGTSDA